MGINKIISARVTHDKLELQSLIFILSPVVNITCGPVLETDIGPCPVLMGFANCVERPSFPVPLIDLGERRAVTMAKAEHEMTIREQAKFTSSLVPHLCSVLPTYLSPAF